MKYMTVEDNEANKKMQSIQEDIMEKENELEDLEDLNQQLIIKERWSNDELVDACRELISILDDEDKKITRLKAECDNEVYNVVFSALNKLNDYYSSGRYPVPELWNNKKKRKASL